MAAGVPPDRIVIDAAHDFGKNTWHSLEVTRRLAEMTETGWPVLVSLSNKDFVGETLNLPPEQRLPGTLAATSICAWLGARIFRVHQVDRVPPGRRHGLGHPRRPAAGQGRQGAGLVRDHDSAALCPAPPLLARELTGADPVVPELRARLASTRPPHSVAASPTWSLSWVWPRKPARGRPAGRLDLSVFAPGVRADTDGLDRLPVAPRAAAARAGRDGCSIRRATQAAASCIPSASTSRPRHARRSAPGLPAPRARVALLVMADGSARRGLRAPGSWTSAAFRSTRPLRGPSGPDDLAALLALDSELARELMATGRAGWQVLAGAMSGCRPTSEIRYCDDPFGVAYLVASLRLGG